MDTIDEADDKIKSTGHADENKLKEDEAYDSEQVDEPEWKSGIHRSNNGFVAIVILILALILALLRAI